jgi:hypothetical protein
MAQLKPSTIELPDGAYFVKNGDTLELWWNGVLVQSWTYTA